MAVEYIAKAARLRLDPRDKFVLIALANYANDEGKAWPKQTTLADWTGYNRGTIIRALESLEDAGLIVSEERRYADGRNASKVYGLRIPDSVAETNTGPSRVDETNPDSVDESNTGRVDETNNNTRQPLPVNIDPSIEPPSPTGNALATRDDPENPFERVREAYNQHRGNLAECRVMNSTRKNKIRTAIKDLGSIENVIAAVALATAEVANDPEKFYERKGYGLDTLLAGQKFIGKAEAAVSRGSVDRAGAEKGRLLNALRGAA